VFGSPLLESSWHRDDVVFIMSIPPIGLVSSDPEERENKIQFDWLAIYLTTVSKKNDPGFYYVPLQRPAMSV
jgi:hypothetical protein